MAMSELGAYLQRHREQLGLSLEELAERTRIRLRFLQAMEAGEWDDLPPGVYARGLLRNYARALGVSPDRVLRMYIKERPSEARLPEPQLISQPLMRQPRLNLELVVALVLLVAAVGLFGWMVGTQLLPAFQSLAPPDEVAPLALNPGSTPTATAPPPTPTRRRGGRVQPLASPAPTPTATPTPALRLEAKAIRNDVWLRVHADGRQVFMDFLRRGESRRWSARQSVRLRTGNAGDTQITINGQRLPPLGDSGDVVEREWRVLEDGRIEQSG